MTRGSTPRSHSNSSGLLKLQAKTPVRLVFYPGEGHGNKRAASRYDYSLRLLRWMEHYLKGPRRRPAPLRARLRPEREASRKEGGRIKGRSLAFLVSGFEVRPLGEEQGDRHLSDDA